MTISTTSEGPNDRIYNISCGQRHATTRYNTLRQATTRYDKLQHDTTVKKRQYWGKYLATSFKH
jgi:hypothetical protein